jgi:hypothetical protein
MEARAVDGQCEMRARERALSWPRHRDFSIRLMIVALAKPEEEFARMLGLFEGRDFEDEVCAFLRRCVQDFQNVPAKPKGDAGLDGLSHGQTVAYCCYGPEQEPSKAKAKGLRTDIIRKFRSDLRTLCELATKGKGKSTKLLHSPTDEMKTILAAGKKLTLVRLVVSVFDTHQLLGPLNTSFDEYRAASQCRYVEQTASLTIWGPQELATVGAIDDLALLRLEQRAILCRVSAAMSGPTPPTVPPATDFDAKFDWLESQAKSPKGAISRTRDHFRKRWSEAIAVENELANNAMVLHEQLSRARQEAAVDADLASGSTSSAMDLLERMRLKFGERLDEQLGAKFPADIRNRLVDGELARLIGECPIDWRS